MNPLIVWLPHSNGYALVGTFAGDFCAAAVASWLFFAGFRALLLPLTGKQLCCLILLAGSLNGMLDIGGFTMAQLSPAIADTSASYYLYTTVLPTVIFHAAMAGALGVIISSGISMQVPKRNA